MGDVVSRLLELFELHYVSFREVRPGTGGTLWALVILTLYSSGSDPPALEVLPHPFQ